MQGMSFQLPNIPQLTPDMLLIFGFVASFIAFVEFILLIYIPFKYYRPTARKLNRIIRKGKDALFLLYDDGRVFIKEVEQISKHGVLKGRGKEDYFILVSSPSKSEGGDPIEDSLRELLNKRAILEDTGSCVFFGYAGRITATTPFVAGTVELANKPGVVGVNPPEGKTPLLIFDLQNLKSIVAKGMGLTAAGLAAIIQDVENRVLAERAKGRFGSLMWFMYILIAIFVIAIALRIIGIGG